MTATFHEAAREILRNVCVIIVFLTVSSCDKDSDIVSPDEVVEIDFEEIEDLATFHGNSSSDIVVITSQGGPQTILESEFIEEFIARSQNQSALFVLVHQAQTRNPDAFNEDITFEKAKEFDIESVGYLKEVVDFFDRQSEKNIYVLGVSFGAFMAQEFIARHGVDLIDGFLIVVGRLDIEDDFWMLFSQGRAAEFRYNPDGTYYIEEDYPSSDDVVTRNMWKLAAGLGFNRYTSRLEDIDDLSKITYIYGDRDERIGPLSNEERQFLTDRGATVMLTEGGTHEAAADRGFSLVKQTFGIR